MWKLCEIQISVSIKFYKTYPHSFIYILSMAAFVPQRQSLRWRQYSPSEPKILTICCLRESLLTLLLGKEDLTPANKSQPARVCCSYSAEELKKNSQEIILEVIEDRETWKGWGKSCYTFKLLLFNRAHFQPILSPVALSTEHDEKHNLNLVIFSKRKSRGFYSSSCYHHQGVVKKRKSYDI